VEAKAGHFECDPATGKTTFAFNNAASIYAEYEARLEDKKEGDQ
jgi:hypothetical protein